MELAEFKETLSREMPPDGLSSPLQALWHAAKGNWHDAHKLAQAQDDRTGAWVHAHLHRIEGDDGNAGYWYRRAEKPHCRASLDQEWEELVSAVLS